MSKVFGLHQTVFIAFVKDYFAILDRRSIDIRISECWRALSGIQRESLAGQRANISDNDKH